MRSMLHGANTVSQGYKGTSGTDHCLTLTLLSSGSCSSSFTETGGEIVGVIQNMQEVQIYHKGWNFQGAYLSAVNFSN